MIMSHKTRVLLLNLTLCAVCVEVQIGFFKYEDKELKPSVLGTVNYLSFAFLIIQSSNQ